MNPKKDEEKTNKKTKVKFYFEAGAISNVLLVAIMLRV
jgi:hypothetical protein